MSIIYLVGQSLNVLDGAESITVSSENTLFPKENLYSTVPAEHFAFNAAGADDTIDADLNRLADGGCENWDDASTMTDWTQSGTVARESSTVHGGTYSAELSASAEIYQTIWVQAGWDMTISAWLYGDGTYYMYGYLKNLYTGKWLNTSSEWQSGETYFGARTAASWGESSKAFTVENYSTCGYQDLVPLRVKFAHQAGGSGGYVDDAALWPHWNFVSVHGHNIYPVVTAKAQSDDNSSYSSVTTQKSMTTSVPAFFGNPSSTVTERYFRLLLEGTNYEAIKIGELIVGQYGTLTRTPVARQPVDTGRRYPQFRSQSRAGHIYRTELSDFVARRKSFEYMARSTTERDEINELLHRAKYGVNLVVFVPFDDESDVLYGILDGELVELRQKAQTDFYVFALNIEEMPFWLSAE